MTIEDSIKRLREAPSAWVAPEALEWLAQRQGPEHRYRAEVHTPLTPRQTEQQTAALYALDTATIAHLLSALDEREALRKDAERYRWMRDVAPAYALRTIPNLVPSEWDAQIDAAKKEQA